MSFVLVVGHQGSNFGGKLLGDVCHCFVFGSNLGPNGSICAQNGPKWSHKQFGTHIGPTGTGPIGQRAPKGPGPLCKGLQARQTSADPGRPRQTWGGLGRAILGRVRFGSSWLVWLGSRWFGCGDDADQRHTLTSYLKLVF